VQGCPSISRGKGRKTSTRKPSSGGGSPESTGLKASSKPRKPKSGIDVGKVVDEMVDQVYMYLGLSDLGLSDEEARSIAREVTEMIVSSYSSKPTLESVIKRLQRSRDAINEYIAGRILELREKPDPKAVEFLVFYGGRALLPEISRVYRLLVEYNRQDLVGALQNIWNKYGPKGMVRCPKCGFNSIAPDYSCVVCGTVVPEKYVRDEIGFNEKFSEYVKTASVAELREAMEAGFLLANTSGIYNPRSPRLREKGVLAYPIHLTRSEVNTIIEEINSREIRI